MRVVVDRIDGGELTPEDLERIEAVYPGKPAKRRAGTASSPVAHDGKAARKSSRAA